MQLTYNWCIVCSSRSLGARSVSRAGAPGRAGAAAAAAARGGSGVKRYFILNNLYVVGR